MFKKYKIADSKLQESVSPDSNVLVFVNPDSDEKKMLAENYMLDEHTMHSALDPEELSRLEFESDHVALIFKRPKNYSAKDHFIFKVASMGLFLFKDKLLIIVSEDIPLFGGKYFQHITGIREIFLKLLYNSIFHYMEHLKVINMISEEIEKKINRSMENKYLLNMFSLEKSLVYYVSAITSNGMMFEKLKNNAAKAGFSARSMEFLDEIIIENTQCSHQAGIYSNILAGLMDARVSIVSNNLNVLMKNLNAVVIAVAVPSFFAGVGGMSEFSAITGAHNWKFAYPLFLLIMAGIGGLTFFIIRRFEHY